MAMRQWRPTAEAPTERSESRPEGGHPLPNVEGLQLLDRFHLPPSQYIYASSLDASRAHRRTVSHGTNYDDSPSLSSHSSWPTKRMRSYPVSMVTQNDSFDSSGPPPYPFPTTAPHTAPTYATNHGCTCGFANHAPYTAPPGAFGYHAPFSSYEPQDSRYGFTHQANELHLGTSANSTSVENTIAQANDVHESPHAFVPAYILSQPKLQTRQSSHSSSQETSHASPGTTGSLGSGLESASPTDRGVDLALNESDQQLPEYRLFLPNSFQAEQAASFPPYHLEPRSPSGLEPTPENSDVSDPDDLTPLPFQAESLFTLRTPNSSPPPTDKVDAYSPDDILCGRGGPVAWHPGNQFFRHLIKVNENAYLVGSRRDKTAISESILHAIRTRGGRFRRESLTSTEDGKPKVAWKEIPPEKAYAKVCQALRESVKRLRESLQSQQGSAAPLDNTGPPPPKSVSFFEHGRTVYSPPERNSSDSVSDLASSSASPSASNPSPSPASAFQDPSSSFPQAEGASDSAVESTSLAEKPHSPDHNESGPPVIKLLVHSPSPLGSMQVDQPQALPTTCLVVPRPSPVLSPSSSTPPKSTDDGSDEASHQEATNNLTPPPFEPDNFYAVQPPCSRPPPLDYLDAFEKDDVLCGRGGPVTWHPGNQFFRQLIKNHRHAYMMGKRRDKTAIADSILETIRSRGGRFLRESLSTKNGKPHVVWEEIPSEKAYEKTCQALREGAAYQKRQWRLAKMSTEKGAAGA